MSKSTMIKDLKMPVVNNAPTLPPPKQEQSEEDVTVQEVLTEIEQEKHIQQPNIQQPSVVHQQDTLSNQLLQQQLLQQQLLQQQLLLQQNVQNEKDSLIKSLVKNIKVLFMSEINMFIFVTLLYIVFQNIDVVSVLKIDKLPLIHNYPILKQIIISVVYALLVISSKSFM